MDRLLYHLKGISYNQFILQLQIICFSIFKAFNRVTNMKEIFIERADSNRFSSFEEARYWIESEINHVHAEYQSTTYRRT